MNELESFKEMLEEFRIRLAEQLRIEFEEYERERLRELKAIHERLDDLEARVAQLERDDAKRVLAAIAAKYNMTDEELLREAVKLFLKERGKMIGRDKS
jgi:hypothetical protein